MKAHSLRAGAVLASAVAVMWMGACSAAGEGSSASGGSGASSGRSGNGGGINLDAGSGGSSAGTGTGTCRQAACATSSYEGEEVPLDMYIMFDRSGSMTEQTSAGGSVWDATKNAIIQFVQAPESNGIGVGIQFFPLGNFSCAPAPFTPPPCLPGCTEVPFFGCLPLGGGSCNANDYLPPAVVIQPLPGVAGEIVNALNAQGPAGGTPTLPAMQSAATATAAYAQQVPGRKVIIVLATDGEPNDCNSTVPAVADVAATAYNGNPSIATFVIGIGNLAGLDQIAQAGGTGSALVVNPATAGQDFLSAMNQIRGRALSCAFQVPSAPAGETISFTQVNVQFTPPGGAACELIYNVGTAGQCDPQIGGWYYDNPQSPGEIRTCPATCDRLQAQRGRVDVQVGCPTEVIPR